MAGWLVCHNMGMNVAEARAYAGLCADCQFARMIRSDRGIAFYQCGKSFADSRYSKYPRLPVRACPGYEPETMAAKDRMAVKD
jgi:hypothetical protein